MIQVFSALLFTGAFALALGVIVSMLGNEWRRVAGLLIGDRDLVAASSVRPVPVRIQARRWAVAPGPSRSSLLRAAA